MKPSRLRQGFGHFHHTTLIIAYAYAAVDEFDLAVRWREYTAGNGYPNLPWFERDPNLNKLRPYPSFFQFLDSLRPRFEQLKALAGTAGTADN